MSQSENPASNQATDSTNAPTKCVGGCGFWGDPSRKNCCSVCFKKMYPEEAQAEADALKNAKHSQQSAASNASPIDSESKEDPNDPNAANPECPNVKAKKKKIQKKKNRCWICRKKMTLAGQFACKCGYTFCAQHRYPDSHDCDQMSDHKKKHQENLAKNNQAVHFKKVEEIWVDQNLCCILNA